MCTFLKSFLNKINQNWVKVCYFRPILPQVWDILGDIEVYWDFNITPKSEVMVTVAMPTEMPWIQ